jgi:DNA-directed RNA polymerase subunit RPC12/RpoP
MKHQCTACWREFSDDSGDPPASGRVHCVFCGARIPLRRPTPHVRNAVPFSKDVPREEAFALGVIGGGGASYPDTLRQFRVRPAEPRPNDTLIPISQGGGGAEPELLEPQRAPWQLGSFWLSLTLGLAVGVAVASSAASFLRRDAGSSPAASPLQAAPVKVTPAAAPASVTPIPSSLPPTCAVASASAPPVGKSVAAPPFNPLLERRGLLDRARAAQRQYRLQDAERSYRRVLAQAPQDSEALAGLGEVEILRGSAEAADAHFKAALAANADYIPALIAVADAQWYGGHGREAQQAYRNIVESYSADLYPPYVAQRSEAAVVPDCGDR